MRRVTSIASGTLDVLPHNGAVITVLGICKLDHKQAYGASSPSPSSGS